MAEENIDIKPTLLSDKDEEELKALRLLIANRQESVSSTFCDSTIPEGASPYILKIIPEVSGISFRRQAHDFDCGQTALETMGLSDEAAKIGRENGRMLNTYDMWEMTDQSKFSFHQNPVSQTENPQLVLYSYSGHGNHWVVEAGGLTFDPARGVMRSQDYQRSFNPKALAAFERKVNQTQASPFPA